MTSIPSLYLIRSSELLSLSTESLQRFNFFVHNLVSIIRCQLDAKQAQLRAAVDRLGCLNNIDE